MPGETKDGLFLFKTEAIILEVCGNNLVERDRTVMQERRDGSCSRRGGVRDLTGAQSSAL